MTTAYVPPTEEEVRQWMEFLHDPAKPYKTDKKRTDAFAAWAVKHYKWLMVPEANEMVTRLREEMNKKNHDQHQEHLQEPDDRRDRAG